MPRGFCIAERGKVAQAPPPCPAPPSLAEGSGNDQQNGHLHKVLDTPRYKLALEMSSDPSLRLTNGQCVPRVPLGDTSLTDPVDDFIRSGSPDSRRVDGPVHRSARRSAATFG